MSKIISVIIKFLNRINKIIWKIIIFLSKFIKLDEINVNNNKPSDERYRLFKVDENPIIEPFCKIEHKDYKQLIKDNNITPVKRRNGKDITINIKCPYFLNNKKYLKGNDLKLYLKHPERDKLRYIYRKFNIEFPSLMQDYRDFIKNPIDISKAYKSHYIIGLCLTYHVNYVLSYRQTASILQDIHEVYISYKTVENYCKSVSTIVQYLLEFYPYQLSNTITADEIYIKILGKN